MRQLLVYGFLCLCWVVAIPLRADEQPWATIPCYRCAAPPAIDGRLRDGIWQQVPWIGGFRLLNATAEYAPVPTRFALCYDDHALYLAVVCQEPYMSGVKADLTGDDAPVYSNDAIEFFVDPLRKHTPYYQLIFNTAGGRYDGKGTDGAWNGTWTVRVLKNAASWQAELCLPFATLGEQPALDQVWGINLARDRYAAGQTGFTTWTAGGRLP